MVVNQEGVCGAEKMWVERSNDSAISQIWDEKLDFETFLTILGNLSKILFLKMV